MIPKEFAVVDVETIPHPSLPEGSRPEFDESSVALGNRKDPYKIAEHIENARLKFEADVDKKMATHPDLCMVVCAVIYYFDGKGEVLCDPVAQHDQSEFLLLSEVWEHVRKLYQEQIPVVSFNGLTFDLPVLIRRAMYSDISVSPQMIANLTKRQDINRHHYDLAALLGLRSPFSGAVEVKSLNYYLKRFGLGSKANGMDGSLVYPLWKEGRLDEIREYCTGDVMETAKLFQRVAPWLVAPKEISLSDKKEKTNGTDE